MPVLKNARHERMAQALAQGKSASDAYEAAGFKPHRQNAARMMTNDDIVKRVDELQAKTVKKVEITVDSLASELEEARAMALKEKQTSAAVSATMGKAKLFGLGVEHRRMSGTIQIINITVENLSVLTRDELTLLEAAYPVLEKLRLVGGDTGSESEA